MWTLKDASIFSDTRPTCLYFFVTKRSQPRLQTHHKNNYVNKTCKTKSCNKAKLCTKLLTAQQNLMDTFSKKFPRNFAWNQSERLHTRVSEQNLLLSWLVHT